MKKSIRFAVVIFILDALIFNQGVIAFITLLVAALVFLPHAIYCQLKRYEYKAKYKNIIIYGTSAICVFAYNYFNNQLAHERSLTLITTIEQYKSDKGIYPESLDSLVPEYLESIPLAKYVFMMNEFSYSVIDGNATLYYISLPPFGRPTYHFNEKKWGYLD